MDDTKAKQQVVEKIKAATSILVTVSTDPSVDALSAALGLTLLLDKLDKHPTAIFSGMIPPAIAFLEPQKTFEDTTDSLRDFIIALDKEKADHLRYKVEGDSVKIFITPFRTTISSDDLEFSQGDYNVELVIALGVDIKEHLDGALDTHGKILHDAPVITLTAGEQVSNLGTVDWHEQKASSLSEMIAVLADGLKKDKSLMDQQIATALLTGIVAETERFSNPHTTSQVMTTAANLMAAGADQQLIAAKLQEPDVDDVSFADAPASDTPTKKSAQDSLKIAHDNDETLEEMDKRVRAEEKKKADEDAKVANAYSVEPAPLPEPAPETGPAVGDIHSSSDAPLTSTEPSFGGTLSATADQAADDKKRELANDQNKTILSHTYVGSSPSQAEMSGATVSENETSAPDPFSQPESINPVYAILPEEPAASQVPEPEASPSVVGERVINPLPAATSPAPTTPSELGLPMPPPIPDFSQAPPAVPAPAYSFEPTPPLASPAPPAMQPPEILGDILAPEQAPPTTPAPAPSNDPSQFKIPGQ